jgi:hypothetical protein
MDSYYTSLSWTPPTLLVLPWHRWTQVHNTTPLSDKQLVLKLQGGGQGWSLSWLRIDVIPWLQLHGLLELFPNYLKYNLYISRSPWFPAGRDTTFMYNTAVQQPMTETSTCAITFV